MSISNFTANLIGNLKQEFGNLKQELSKHIGNLIRKPLVDDLLSISLITAYTFMFNSVIFNIIKIYFQKKSNSLINEMIFQSISEFNAFFVDIFSIIFSGGCFIAIYLLSNSKIIKFSKKIISNIWKIPVMGLNIILIIFGQDWAPRILAEISLILLFIDFIIAYDNHVIGFRISYFNKLNNLLSFLLITGLFSSIFIGICVDKPNKLAA